MTSVLSDWFSQMVNRLGKWTCISMASFKVYLTRAFTHWWQREHLRCHLLTIYTHVLTHQWPCLQEQFGDQYLAQGHFDTLTAWVEDQTTNPLIRGGLLFTLSEFKCERCCHTVRCQFTPLPSTSPIHTWESDFSYRRTHPPVKFPFIENWKLAHGCFRLGFLFERRF